MRHIEEVLIQLSGHRPDVLIERIADFSMGYVWEASLRCDGDEEACTPEGSGIELKGTGRDMKTALADLDVKCMRYWQTML